MFGNYSKLAGSIVGTIVGNLVALLFVYLAFKGIATCETVDSVESCKVLGLTQVQVTAGVVGAVNAALVWAFPANKPT